MKFKNSFLLLTIVMCALCWKVSGEVFLSLSQEEQKVINLVNYAKRKGAYGAKNFLGGYQSFMLNDKYIEGQRDTLLRLKQIPYDFNGKSVLDIGSNQGALLHLLADQIAYGVGIDFNYKLINFANKLKSVNKVQNLDFYVFDLENEPLDLINNFLKTKKVDICFLLAVSGWLKNWKLLLDYIYTISDVLLFESNSYVPTKIEQLEYLKQMYKRVVLLDKNFEDDKKQHRRTLALCYK